MTETAPGLCCRERHSDIKEASDQLAWVQIQVFPSRFVVDLEVDILNAWWMLAEVRNSLAAKELRRT